MKTALAFAILALFLVIIAVIVASEHPTPMAMGMVQTAAPAHGFVCTPAITPRIRIARAKEIA